MLRVVVLTVAVMGMTYTYAGYSAIKRVYVDCWNMFIGAKSVASIPRPAVPYTIAIPLGEDPRPLPPMVKDDIDRLVDQQLAQGKDRGCR